jgi:hypothetical protein
VARHLRDLVHTARQCQVATEAMMLSGKQALQLLSVLHDSCRSVTLSTRHQVITAHNFALDLQARRDLLTEIHEQQPQHLVRFNDTEF